MDGEKELVIIQILGYQEPPRRVKGPDDKLIDETTPGMKRLLGLGEDNLIYMWNWFRGEWQPYMHYAAQVRLNVSPVADVED